MALEIERKFLIDKTLCPLPAEGVKMVQGYLMRTLELSIRLRLAGEQAYLTIKGAQKNFTRSEFEYSIPTDDAKRMLEEFCSTRIVDKIRHYVPADGKLVWEIDEYLGLNEGLFTAEIELPSADTVYSVPEWIGQDVTDRPEYSNGSLSKRPYSTWSAS